MKASALSVQPPDAEISRFPKLSPGLLFFIIHNYKMGSYGPLPTLAKICWHLLSSDLQRLRFREDCLVLALFFK